MKGFQAFYGFFPGCQSDLGIEDCLFTASGPRRESHFRHVGSCLKQEHINNLIYL
ncbi:hypothetical protein DGo_PB0350 (plasmid) [Deinococcus gobiensis I-0]|uniref:Uncharacterized protein n=1 Tax=Deinococcus gobiensis (strain DSM 21396 / JCM 16679 / CGMCC 1.7299 / I-0) TaxID=745776 RepID=H8H272_DEIGI|nr:hypothetical protein DGo_PB0350 [Deinococcus gobiensis I-0]